MDKQERENVAANAVADVLTALLGLAFTPSKWDDGTVARMHDFYLNSSTDRIALEVSTIADGTRVGRDIRWDRQAPDQLIPIDGLAGAVWLATVEDEAEAADVVRVLSNHLPTLAALGATSVETRRWQEHWLTTPDHRPAEFEPMLALNRVGVSAVSQIGNASAETLRDLGGKVQVLRAHGHTRPANPNYPVTVLNDQLANPDLHASDVAKLNAVSDATQRHLWLWVEIHEGLPIRRSFDAEGLPTDDIDCETLDGLWLGWGAADDQVAGVYWARGSGWHHFTGEMNRTVR